MVNTKIRLIIFFAVKDGEALYSQQKQDQELTVAQTMNSLLPNSDLKKVGKTTRSFKYDLHQIPYDYTVEMINRFKGLDLIDKVPDELWTEVCDTVQSFSIFDCKEYNQSALGIDHLVMSMCRVFFCAVGRGVYYDQCILLVKLG